jgi:hypothetical protein
VIRIRAAEPRRGVCDEGGGAIRVGSREEGAEREPLLEAEEDGAFRPRGIQDGANVVHSRLEGQLLLPRDDVVGKARSAPVEDDHAREAGDPLEELGLLGPVPHELDVEHEPRNED